MKQKQTCACKQSPPPFSSLSEHSTRGNDSSLGGGVCSALPSVPRGLRKASTLMHDIIQPRSRRKRRRREAGRRWTSFYAVSVKKSSDGLGGYISPVHVTKTTPPPPLSESSQNTHLQCVTHDVNTFLSHHSIIL